MCRNVALRLAVAAVALGTCAAASAQVRLDARWWKTSTSDMQRGAVNGAFDCLAYERAAKLPLMSVPTLDSAVDEAFRHDDGRKTLADVLVSLPKQQPPPPPGGEDFSKEKHGWFDSYYWGSAPDEERIGFLVGYLSCGRELRVPMWRIKHYRDLVDSWYDGHHGDAKVADVIRKVLKTEQ